MPRFPRLFPNRSLPNLYSFSSAGLFDNSAQYSVVGGPSTIFKRTSWHKRRMRKGASAKVCVFSNLAALRLCGENSFLRFIWPLLHQLPFHNFNLLPNINKIIQLFKSGKNFLQKFLMRFSFGMERSVLERTLNFIPFVKEAFSV